MHRVKGRVATRDANADDVSAMGAVLRAAAIAAWPHIIPIDVLSRLAFPQRFLEYFQREHPRVDVLVALLEEQVVGFAVTRPSADEDADDETGELDGFYTHPRVWGMGVGQALHDAALSRLQANGFQAATLWTARHNHRPRRFYEQAGWHADGVERTRAIEGSQFDELRYRRSI
jgi:GNAT superfamily N-acetyltransferase